MLQINELYENQKNTRRDGNISATDIIVESDKLNRQWLEEVIKRDSNYRFNEPTVKRSTENPPLPTTSNGDKQQSSK